VLILLFHNFFQPVTIMMALPLSLGGAVIGLLMGNMALSMPALIGILMILEMSIVLGGQYFQVLDTPLPPELANSSNTKDLGLLLYTQYTYPDQVAAAILLVAIIAAIILTYRGRKDSKKQVIADQVAVKAADRLRVVKMDAVKPEPAVTPASASEAGDGAAK